ncbi:tim22-like protein [Niveomyces insectorum RCEF 264]|uniref:Mitochondrial import inner membrane translocase subunit TIM22 n=1 Tax=Niveomyces insectorum RCEF 264 TaxID=1081102 RepID=A0A167Z206_9HYPO|nr:tim22-like protein [Niveomyces insectorum RCEF 264]
MNFPGSGLPGRGVGPGPSGFDPNDPNAKRLQAAMESCFVKAAMGGAAGFALGGVFGMFMASVGHTNTGSSACGRRGGHGGGDGSRGHSRRSRRSKTGDRRTGTSSTSRGSRGAASTTATTRIPSGLPRAMPAAAAAPAAAASPAGGAAVAYTPATVTSLPLRQQLAYGFKDMGARSFSSAKNFGMVSVLFAGIECGVEGLRAKNDMVNGVTAGCLTGAILARKAGPQAAALGCAGFAAFSAAIDAYMRMPPSDD